MQTAGRQGFTFVEILTVLALFAVLVLIAWGTFNRSHEKALTATLVSDLRNVTTAQELYHRLNLNYAGDIGTLRDALSPSPRSEVHITAANPRGWAGWNEIEGSDQQCEIYVGREVDPPLGVATTSEKIFCKIKDVVTLGR